MISYAEIINRGRELEKTGKLNDAVNLLKAKVTELKYDTEEDFEFVLFLSELYIRCDKLDEGLMIIQSVIKKSQNNTNLSKSYLEANFLMANVLYKQGKYDDSLKKLAQIENNLESDSKIQLLFKSKLQAKVYSLKGSIQEYKGDFDGALESFKNGLELSRKNNDIKLIATLLRYSGISHVKKGNLEEALTFFNESLVLKEEIGNVIKIGNNLSNIGVVYKLKGELDTAISYYQKAFEFIKNTDNKDGIANLLNNIGNIYRTKGEIDEAFKYYQKSFAILEEINSKAKMGILHINFGVYYKNKGEFNKALDHHYLGLKIHEEIGNPQPIALSTLCIGQIHLIKMDYKRATKYLGKSLKLFEEMKNNIDTSLALFHLINIALEEDNLKLAKTYLDKLQKMNEHEDNKFISLRYRFAHALYTQHDIDRTESLSFRSLHKILDKYVTAIEILRTIINEDIVEYEQTVEAIFNLSELLIVELRTLGNETILLDLDNLVKRLLEIGTAQNAFSLLAKTYLLQSKLELLKPNVHEAKKLLIKAEKISKEKGYNKLSRVIQNEIMIIEKSHEDWIDIANSSLLNRISKINIEGLLSSLRRNRLEIYTSDLKVKTPGMKELIDFANTLKERSVSW